MLCAFTCFGKCCLLLLFHISTFNVFMTMYANPICVQRTGTPIIINVSWRAGDFYLKHSYRGLVALQQWDSTGQWIDSCCCLALYSS